MSCYLVGGTQAEKATNNELIVMKLSNLNPIEGLILLYKYQKSLTVDLCEQISVMMREETLR